MIQLRKRPPSFWPLLSLFFAITISTVLVGFIYFFYQKKNILREKQNELSAISYLGIRQITQWRDERIGDAKFLEENGVLAGKFSEYLRNPNDLRIRDNIIQNLKSLTDHFDYGEALLLRENGIVSLGYPKSDTATQNLKSLLPSVLTNKRAIFYDQPPTDKENFFRIDLIIPLIDKDHNDTVVKGFLDLRIDPSKTLYPILKSWPTSYNSTETILIKKENDKIVLLNKPDNILSPVLTESTDKQLIADMAVHGITGTINGIDCSGNVVVAALNKIPDTSWYLIVKVDRKEVLASLTSQVKLIFIILLLIIIASGSFLAFLIRSQRADYYREKYEDELSRLALIKHFDYILKYANDIILLINSDLAIVEANDRALEYYQYTREEFIGKYVNEIRAKESRDQIEEDIRKVNSNGSATFETIHLRKDNSTFPVEVSTRVVTIENAKYYQSISRDITDRKKVENILRESEEKFRKIFQESPYSTLMTGKDFEILKVNSTFCNLIGYSEDELKQFTFRNFTHPDHIKNDEIGLLKLIAGEIPVYKCEKRYIRQNGSVMLASTNVSIIRDKNDEVQFFLVMIEDITSRKKAEEELITAKDKAEESDRLKTAFLHNVSHEIRTPMNAIIGFSSLMRDLKLSEAERNQYVEIIYQSGEQLLSIINDIVDIANIESGQVKVNLSVLNLNSALKKLNEQFIFSSSQKNININLFTAFSDENSDIQTDGTKLIQIISNLINNAIKFTKDGKIDFGYTLNDRYIEFFVSDSGIGIPKEHLDRIFDRFYQVDNAISRQFSGTGLGLSICKGYVELLGGTIGVESEPGSGTKFSFSIPNTLS